MSGPDNRPALFTRFGLLSSSWPGSGPPGRFQPGLHPGNLELLLTLLHSQIRIICSDTFTFGISTMAVPLALLDFGNLEVEGMLWQYEQVSVSLAVKYLYYIISCPSAPGQEVGPLVDNLYCLVPCWFTRLMLWYPHIHHHWSLIGIVILLH